MPLIAQLDSSRVHMFQFRAGFARLTIRDHWVRSLVLLTGGEKVDVSLGSVAFCFHQHHSQVRLQKAHRFSLPDELSEDFFLLNAKLNPELMDGRGMVYSREEFELKNMPDGMTRAQRMLEIRTGIPVSMRVVYTSSSQPEAEYQACSSPEDSEVKAWRATSDTPRAGDSRYRQQNETHRSLKLEVSALKVEVSYHPSRES